METYPLPAHSAHVHIALFTQLTNAATLRTRLITASTLPADDPGNDERAAVDFAFIDASMVSPHAQSNTPADEERGNRSHLDFIS